MLSARQAGGQQVRLSAAEATMRTATVWVFRDSSPLDGAIFLPGFGAAIANGDPTAVEIFDSAGKKTYHLPTRADAIKPVPRTALAVADNVLFIADRRTALVGRYALGSPEIQLAPLRVTGEISDMCTRGDEAVIHVSSVQASLLRTDRSGRIRTMVAKVGDVLPAGLEPLHNARLVCLSRGVIVVGVLDGTLRFFTSDGTKRWTAALGGFRGLEASIIGKSVVFRTVGECYDRVIRAVALTQRVLAVQTACARSASRTAWGQVGVILTRYIDTASGREIGRTSHDPEMLSAFQGRVLIANPKTQTVSRHRFSFHP